MIEDIKEIKEVTEVKETKVGEVRRCDICNKIIYDTGEDLAPYEKKHWWELTTCHSDWGYESLESYSKYDICSPECLKVKFDEYCKESNSAINTMEFNVEHKYR